MACAPRVRCSTYLTEHLAKQGEIGAVAEGVVFEAGGFCRLIQRVNEKNRIIL